MSFEFIAKNGFISKGNSVITGSLIVTTSITSSLTGSHTGNTIGTASWANNAQTGLYSSQSQWSVSSSYASSSTTAGTATNLGQTAYNISVTYASQSQWSVSSSYASASTTATTATNLGQTAYNISVTYASQSNWAVSSSFASSSVSSSYLTGSHIGNTIGTASWANISQTGLYASQSNWTVSASYASASTTAGTATNLGLTAYNISVTYASQSQWAVSSSYASASTTAATATTATTATNLGQTAYNISVTYASQSNWAVSSSFASSSLTSSVDLIQTTASNATSYLLFVLNTASYQANFTTTSLTVNPSVGGITANSFTGSHQGTSSWAVSASWAPGAASTFAVSSSYASSSTSASYALSASWAPGGGISPGTNNYIPKWSGGSLTATSEIYDDGTAVVIANTSGSTGRYRFVVQQGGLTNVDNNYMSEFHTDNDRPFCCGFFNNTFNLNTASLEFFVENIGNCYWGTHFANDIRFYTNGFGNDRLVLSASGQVGIGTNVPNPLVRMHVFGDMSCSIMYGTAVAAMSSFYATSASFASASISSSYALSASWAPGGPSNSSSYALSSSWSDTGGNSISASYALSASWAPGGTGGSGLFASQSQWAVSSSWASSSYSSSVDLISVTASNATSYLMFTLNTGSFQGNYVTTSLTVNPSVGGITANSFTGSFTGSHFGTSSWAVSASWAPGVASSQAVSASFASSSVSASFTFSSSYALSASYARTSSLLISVTSASFASSSVSASYALSASWAPGAGGGSGLFASQSQWAVSASWASQSYSSSVDLVQVTASNATAYLMFALNTGSYQSNYVTTSISVNPSTGVHYGNGFGTVGSTTVNFLTNNTNRWQIDNNGNLLAATDNAFDFGASGANRVKNVYVAGFISASTFTGNLNYNNSIQSQGTVASSASVILDFGGTFTSNYFIGSGSTNFTSSNLSAGRNYKLFVSGSAANTTANCVIHFPAWHFMTGAPTTFTANKVGVLTLEAFGSIDSQVVAYWAEEP